MSDKEKLQIAIEALKDIRHSNALVEVDWEKEFVKNIITPHRNIAAKALEKIKDKPKYEEGKYYWVEDNIKKYVAKYDGMLFCFCGTDLKWREDKLKVLGKVSKEIIEEKG